MLPLSSEKPVSDGQLSICIPAYNRPGWLYRALNSVLSQVSFSASRIEVVVSDDSTKKECGTIARSLLSQHEGPWHYVHNSPRLGMVENWNQAISLASGRYVLLLHDDDYLTRDALSCILHVVNDPNRSKPVMLFGVNVVDGDENKVRQQSFSAPKFLPPATALLRLLSNSSFVRFPGLVIRRSLFENVGYFDAAVGYPADLDMWIRLMSRVGVFCHPCITVNYTVHEGALTTNMFKKEVIYTLMELFEKARATELLGSTRLDQCRTQFFHQYILAGTWRSIKQGKWFEARRVFSLLDQHPLDKLRLSIKWLPVRLSFALLLSFQKGVSHLQITSEGEC